jgi:signal transduction histidine kinase
VGSISRVSDNIAHELRTPLSRLRAELEDMVASADDPLEVRARSLAAVGEAERLQTMFEALLRLARLQSGAKGQFAQVRLSRLLEDAAELHGPAADDKGQALVTAIDPGLALTGDRDLIFQMISNLLDNAVKFTPPGGRVDVAARLDGDAIVVEVADNGPGVPAADRLRVFERFYRVEGVGAAQGFGLGLSLVAAAAERHEADVRLEDAEPGLRVVMRFKSSLDIGDREALTQ